MTGSAPHTAHRTPRRGITLVELLVASMLGLVVLVGIGQIDVTRITTTHDIRGFSVAQMEASYGLTHMVKQLEGADRVNLLSPTNLQLRLPTGTSFDDAANYVWKQYKYNAGAREIRFYDPAGPACTLSAQFRDIAELNITQGAPPDINELEIAIAYTTPVTGRMTTYTGQVMIRGGSDVATGLAPSGVSNPPADCP